MLCSLTAPPEPPPPLADFDEARRCAAEIDHLGFTLTRHPGESVLLDGTEHLPANGVSSTYGEITAHPLLVHSLSTEVNLRWVTTVGPSSSEENGRLEWEDLTIPLAWNQECL